MTAPSLKYAGFFTPVSQPDLQKRGGTKWVFDNGDSEGWTENDGKRKELSQNIQGYQGAVSDDAILVASRGLDC
jgi:hypothetical protein